MHDIISLVNSVTRQEINPLYKLLLDDRFPNLFHAYTVLETFKVPVED